MTHVARDMGRPRCDQSAWFATNSAGRSQRCCGVVSWTPPRREFGAAARRPRAIISGANHAGTGELSGPAWLPQAPSARQRSPRVAPRSCRHAIGAVSLNRAGGGTRLIWPSLANGRCSGPYGRRLSFRTSGSRRCLRRPRRRGAPLRFARRLRCVRRSGVTTKRVGDERRVIMVRGVVQVPHRRPDVGVPHPLLDSSDISAGDHARAERVAQIVEAQRSCIHLLDAEDLDVSA